jgi:hypothetical protein
VPPAEAPTFPSNPQASKKRNPAPTPSPSPNPTPRPLPDPFRHNEPYHPFCPADDDEKGRKSSMRIEVQYKKGGDYGIPANAPRKMGVTLVQIQNTINEFKVNVEARVPDSKWFPLKDYRSQFNKGIEKALAKAIETNRLRGTDDREYTLSSVQWDEDTGNFVKRGSYRVELVNKSGRNLQG